jgi:hypothetical protein
MINIKKNIWRYMNFYIYKGKNKNFIKNKKILYKALVKMQGNNKDLANKIYKNLPDNKVILFKDFNKAWK